MVTSQRKCSLSGAIIYKTHSAIVWYKRNYPWYLTTKDAALCSKKTKVQKIISIIYRYAVKRFVLYPLFRSLIGWRCLVKIEIYTESLFHYYWVLNCNLMRDEMSLMAQKTSFLLMFVLPTQNLGCLFFLDVTYLLWFICFVCMKVSSIIGHKGCSIHLPHDTIFIILFRIYFYCPKV